MLHDAGECVSECVSVHVSVCVSNHFCFVCFRANETSILVGSPLDEDATLPLSSGEVVDV
eukprot:m.47119 g.47119  ORF g.47119 m.47119 type:complete len:60 (+) comp10744_c0_seq5:737-916(+)